MNATPRSRTSARIEQRMVAAFAALFGGLTLLIVVAGSAIYVQQMAKDRETLVLLVGDTLAQCLEGVQFSGKFRARFMLEQMVADNAPLAYVSVVDPGGIVLAHSDPARNDQDADPDGLALVRATMADGERRMWARQVDGEHISEVLQPLSGGYGDQRIGVVRVGVHTDSLGQTLLRGAGPVSLLLLGALALMLPAVVVVSRRLGRPIKRQADELRGILDHAPLLISIQDADGSILRASAEFSACFGLSAPPHPTLQQLLPELPALGADQQPVRSDLHVTIDGEDRALFASRFPVATNPQGAVLLECFMAADVTEQREASAQQARLAAAVEQADDPVLIVDGRGRVLYANPALERLTGIGLAEACTMAPSELLGGTEAQRQEQEALLAQAQPWRGRVEVPTRAGAAVPCSQVISPIVDDAGRRRGLVAVIRDTSREEQLEAQLRQAQKMEAVGRLAGGIAHDFNNLLTIMLGRAGLLEALLPPDSPHLAAVVEIQDTGMRAAALTSQLLAFSRQQDLDVSELDPASVVAHVLPLLRRVIGEDIEISWTHDDQLWPILADRGQLEQVLLNLAVNARDAMPEGGRLALTAVNRHLSGDSRSGPTEVPAGDYVQLSVSDTGHGIPEPLRDSIFEPFFTTKEVGKGTGLGLAMAHGILRQFGGHIWLESPLDRGATFHVALPRASAADQPAPVASPLDDDRLPPGGSEHILVVEDDASVRQVLCALLMAAGYRTTEAGDGVAALAILAQLDPPPDLVLTDLVMPRMKGAELVVRLRQLHPTMPVLLMSGYSEDLAAHRDELAGLPLLRKPPSLAALRQAVRQALDG